MSAEDKQAYHACTLEYLDRCIEHKEGMGVDIDDTNYQNLMILASY
jgi:hypothetical protein